MIARRILIVTIVLICLLPLMSCTTPEVACGIRADYDGQCDGEGTVMLRYHFGTPLNAPTYGVTNCWMREDGLRMCEIDLVELRARFSDACELVRLGHEACHSMNGHHGK